jgi:alpha-glucuronidase
MKTPIRYLFIPALYAFLACLPLSGEDGYRLWLRYDAIHEPVILRAYHSALKQIMVEGHSGTLDAVREELQNGLSGMLGKKIPFVSGTITEGTLLIGTPESSARIAALPVKELLKNTGQDGFIIKTCMVSGMHCIVITANEDIGLLYGTFHFLRFLQTRQQIGSIDLVSVPSTQFRLLNHWDNLNRTVERGYAGFSLWEWHLLPDYVSPRYKDYARANASIGINGAVLTNVNANALILTPQYLEKTAALAEAFRPYGIRVYLTARFSAPVEIGGLSTADPLDPQVIEWWQKKADEIYRFIPDFGGLLVKANSEGQPGPQNYGRSHAEGANMLAHALAPHGGIVMWRAFVYDNNVPEDRAKQATNEFKPLDGNFSTNVFVQVKNGPIDFQPREPFHPLFGSMPGTPLMMEFQLTQEYLGQGTHLVYLAPLFKECLQADTYAQGKGSEVARIIDGTLEKHGITGMAGVSNIGTDRNWCGHPFAQSNWYAFGRLAWDLSLPADSIAEEWLRVTFTNNVAFIAPVKQMMLGSREYAVNYMTPLGLHHIMARDHHHGPGPWVSEGRPDWTSVYYHRADTAGIGFDRTAAGSNALSQYYPEVRQRFEDTGSCPESMLLWFHHMPWDHRMASGRTLWEELCYRYYDGADSVKKMQQTWKSLEGMIDQERFDHVKAMLSIQVKEAVWWRDACVLYFQTFSRRPIPEGLEKPAHTLEYYRNIKEYYVPGI